jgi:hypothetical protein
MNKRFAPGFGLVLLLVPAAACPAAPITYHPTAPQRAGATAVTRFLSTENQPQRYFGVRRN